jgi:hypothetical protein
MFDDNKVIWSVRELEVGAAGDRLYEAVAKYLAGLGHEFGWSDLPGLGKVLFDNRSDVVKVVGFVFETIEIRPVLDRVKDLVVMLERDNDWVA